MSIDKTSSGLPEMDVRKRTTRVNLSVIVAVLLFLAAMAGVAYWIWSSNP